MFPYHVKQACSLTQGLSSISGKSLTTGQALTNENAWLSCSSLSLLWKALQEMPLLWPP